MDCHECAQVEVDRPAVATCRYGSIGLCKEHLVETYRSPMVPLYTCLHHPEQGSGRSAAGPRTLEAPTLHRAAL